MLTAARVLWLFLITGTAWLLFSIAGDFGHKVILLVVWVGLAALMRGISGCAEFLRSSSPSRSKT
jgi:hypothetical protein